MAACCLRRSLHCRRPSLERQVGGHLFGSVSSLTCCVRVYLQRRVCLLLLVVVIIVVVVAATAAAGAAENVPFDFEPPQSPAPLRRVRCGQLLIAQNSANLNPPPAGCSLAGPADSSLRRCRRLYVCRSNAPLAVAWPARRRRRRPPLAAGPSAVVNKWPPGRRNKWSSPWPASSRPRAARPSRQGRLAKLESLHQVRSPAADQVGSSGPKM